MKEFTKDGRQFFVVIEGREVFLGTPAVFSTIATQMISREIAKPLRWKAISKFIDLSQDTQDTVLVGYRIPWYISTKKAESLVERLFD